MRIQLISFTLHHISSFLILLCLFIDCSEQCAATAPGTTPQPSGSRTTLAATTIASVTTTVSSATTTTVADATTTTVAGRTTTTTVADQTTTTVATTTTVNPACVCAQSLITILQGTDLHVDPTSVIGSADGCGTDSMGTHSTITFTCQGMPPGPADHVQISFYSNGADIGVIPGDPSAMATLDCMNGQWRYAGLVVTEVDCQVIQ